MSIVDRIDRDIKVAVLTVSDTRDKTTDKGGKAGHRLYKNGKRLCAGRTL